MNKLEIVKIILDVQNDTLEGIRKARISALEKTQCELICQMMGEEIKKRLID